MNRWSSSSRVLSLMVSVWALVSCAAPQHAASQALRSQVGAYELEVLVDGASARTFSHDGETHILGQEGSRYLLRVHNRSGRRIEAVVSVDGLDVIDGRPGDFANKRGYLVGAHSYVDIDGWRLSNRQAAAFRFAPIGESYAAKTGRARNVGVIGVAVFPERIVRVQRSVQTPWYPDDYAPRSSAPSEDRAASEGHAEDESSDLGRRIDRHEDKAAPPAAPSAGSGGAGAASARAEPAPKKTMSHSRSGLGTEFGEAVSSEIQHVEFVRAQASHPAAFLGTRYNDRAGLYALGIDVDAPDQASELSLRQSADPFPGSRHYARPPADWRRD